MKRLVGPIAWEAARPAQIALLWAVLAALMFAAPARAEPPVDLALILSVDVSQSMDEDEEKLQRSGYVQALNDPQVVAAIQSGRLHRIAMTYVEWSSQSDQRVLVGWRVISDAASAKAFADELAKAPFRAGTTTSISGGIDFSVRLFDSSGLQATRRVIDVSGDGHSDYGRPIKVSRDDAVAAGITINGLAIMNDRPSWRERAPPDLDRYYAENVIGGPGSFVIIVKDLRDFGKSVLRKLIIEIAQRGDGDPGQEPGAG